MRLGPIIGLASLVSLVFACGGGQDNFDLTPSPSASPLVVNATATVSPQTLSTATFVPTVTLSPERSPTPQPTSPVSRLTQTPTATAVVLLRPTQTPTLEPSATLVPIQPTPIPTATVLPPSHTPTSTAIPLPSATETVAPTPSLTVTPVQTAAITPGTTAVPTFTATPTPASTQTFTPSPTLTPAPTATQTSTITPTPIPTAVPTLPPTPSPTVAPTPAPTSTSIPTATAVSQSTTIESSIRVSSITSAAFKATWVTNGDASGWLEWGETPQLGNTAQDQRGPDTIDDIHSVQIGRLKPETTYFFDVVVDGDRQNNGGVHYTVKTSPVIGIPPLTIGIGFVTRPDGTPVTGCVVHLSFIDNDSTGSPGRSQPLSVLVSETGAWAEVIGSVLQADSTAFFNYNQGGGDNLVIEADCGAQGRGELVVDSGALEPTAPLVIEPPGP